MGGSPDVAFAVAGCPIVGVEPAHCGPGNHGRLQPSGWGSGRSTARGRVRSAAPGSGASVTPSCYPMRRMR